MASLIRPAPNDLLDLSGEPVVSGRQRAVMGVVTEIGGDEREGWEGISRQGRVEMVYRQVVPRTFLGKGAVVGRRVMANRIQAGIAAVAWPGHRLRVGPPARCLGEDALSRGRTARGRAAVGCESSQGVEPKAGGCGHVVGKTW